MSRTLTLGLLLLTWLGVSAPRARADLIEQVVAYVDDHPIFLSELRTRARAMGADTMGPEDLQRTFNELLSQMIDEQLISTEARRVGLRVTADEVLRAVAEVMAQNGLGEEDFWQTVEAQGMSRAEYENAVQAQILRLKLFQLRAENVVIDDAEVRLVWSQRPRSRRPEPSYRISQVFIDTAEGATPAQRNAARERAHELHRQLSAGELSFDQAQQQATGEQVGWIAASELAGPLLEALQRLSAGQRTPVLESEHGFQILMLHEIRRAGPPSFEDEREAIHRELIAERVAREEERVIERLRSDAYIVRRLDR